MRVNGFNLKKVGQVEFVLDQDYQGVPVKVFAQESLVREMDREVFAQARNVAQLPGLVGNVFIMPDAHSGYGAPIGTVFAMEAKEGYVSPGAIGYDINCGMRLIRTELVEEEIKPFLRRLVNRLFDYVPAGAGRKGFLKLNKGELKQLVEQGAAYLIRKGIGWQEDIENIEEKGWLKEADFSTVSDRAIERGLAQIATLGSGNHYLEIQSVEKIFDQKTANKMGINRQGQVVIMIHCGSRGFGHQICSDYLKLFKKHLSQFKIKLPDLQLALAPINSSYGQRYLAAMSAAANFAFANREAITHRVREVFETVLGKRAREELKMDLVYDVAHNIGKVEEHIVLKSGKPRRLLIHRKGATRSFPGQPVIVGGSMETGSYLLLGKEAAIEKAFGSTAHGSGRVMSRTKAKRLIRGERLWQKMQKKGIYVKTASFAGLAEEAGFAYKDISQVVESVDKAGLSKPVAYFRPIGNIKG